MAPVDPSPASDDDIFVVTEEGLIPCFPSKSQSRSHSQTQTKASTTVRDIAHLTTLENEAEEELGPSFLSQSQLQPQEETQTQTSTAAPARAPLTNEEKRRAREANKARSSKGEAIKEMIVEIDAALVASDTGALHDVLAPLRQRLLDEGVLSVEFFDGGSITSLIRWKRRTKAKMNEETRTWVPLEEPVTEEENTVLFFLPAEELATHLERGSLSTTIHDVRQVVGHTHQIFVMVDGMEKYFRKRRNAINRDFTAAVRGELNGVPVVDHGECGSSRGGGRKDSSGVMTEEDVYEELLRLQVVEKCFIVHVDRKTEVVEWLVAVTSDISIRPFKLLRNSHLPFCPDARTPTGKDDSETYRYMLQQIPKVTHHTALGIQRDFPTLRSLFEAYERTSNRALAEQLLADCVISHTRNGVANARVVGNNMSKRIYDILQGTDPLMLING